MNALKTLIYFAFLLLPFFTLGQTDLELRRAKVRAKAQADWQQEFSENYNGRKERLALDSVCFFDGEHEFWAFSHKRVGVHQVVDSLGRARVLYIDTLQFTARTEHFDSLEVEAVVPRWSDLEKDTAFQKFFWEKMKNRCFVDTSEWMVDLAWDLESRTLKFDRSMPFSQQAFAEIIAEVSRKAEEQGLDWDFWLTTYPNIPWCLVDKAVAIDPAFLSANRYILINFELGNKVAQEAYYNVLLIN